MRKNIKIILAVLLILSAIIIGYFFVGFPKVSEDIAWGVNFSQKRAEEFGFDWKEVYLAALDDLGAKNIKLAVHWDLVEKADGEYYFDDVDYQLRQAQDRGAKVILVIGRKTPGWPECHVPRWAEELGKEEQQIKILALLENIVLRYRDWPAVEYWQVENEPFFPFGECLWKDNDFLKKEVDLVKSIDSSRSVIISESGEFPLWFKAASNGDILGITMYRRAFFGELGLYVNYPFPPVFYDRKASLIRSLLKKDVFCVELQAEPWGPALNFKLSMEEQEKSMTLEKLKKNIDFAQRTGLERFYFWGTEWWYWMKEENKRPEFWDETKKLFQ